MSSPAAKRDRALPRRVAIFPIHAIALRYSTAGSWDDQVVVVIDGGFGDDGSALVEHIQRWYGTSTVDPAVNTHPDGDHVGGLPHVLEHLAVRELLVHDPRAHLSSTDGLALDAVLGLIDLADELGIPAPSRTPG